MVVVVVVVIVVVVEEAVAVAVAVVQLISVLESVQALPTSFLSSSKVSLTFQQSCYYKKCSTDFGHDILQANPAISKHSDCAKGLSCQKKNSIRFLSLIRYLLMHSARYLVGDDQPCYAWVARSSAAGTMDTDRLCLNAARPCCAKTLHCYTLHSTVEIASLNMASFFVI